MPEQLFDKRLEFNEEQHIYSLADQPDLELTSATTFIHRWFAPFEREKIAQKLITTVPKYADKSPEDLYEDWAQSGISGTNVHNALEEFILKFNKEGGAQYDTCLKQFCQTDIENNKARHGMDWLGDNVFNKENLVLYPEVKVVSRDYQIAGMMDLLVHD